MGFFKLPKDRIMDVTRGKTFLSGNDIFKIHQESLYLDNSDKFRILNHTESALVRNELERDFFPKLKIFEPIKPLDSDIFNSNSQNKFGFGSTENLIDKIIKGK